MHMDVSILVVMEVGHKVIAAIVDKDFIEEFQSLLSWKLVIKILWEIYNEIQIYTVSILVVMEVGHKEQEAVLRSAGNL